MDARPFIGIGTFAAFALALIGIAGPDRGREASPPVRTETNAAAVTPVVTTSGGGGTTGRMLIAQFLGDVSTSASAALTRPANTVTVAKVVAPAATVTLAATVTRAAASSPDTATAGARAGSVPNEPGAEGAATGAPVRDTFALDILIVSVADPVDSHLDWAYDAQINAARRALERQGFVIDRFWLPWDSEGRPPTAGKERTDLRVRMPGVMLFRHSNPQSRRLRLLYVVGEVPTSGVHKLALDRALHERDSLLRGMPFIRRDTTASDTLRIVGPVFSGAAPSLLMAIERWRNGDASRHVRIVSGSASNIDNLRTLAAPGIEFRATVHDDVTLGRFQREILARRLGISPQQTAILQETSTQFGQRSRPDVAADSAPDGSSEGTETRSATRVTATDAASTTASLDSAAIVIPFPMHINELRKDYACNLDQVVTAAAAAGASAAAPRPSVRLEEQPTLADGPAVLSHLTPPAVDAMLDDIAHTLNVHRIRAVGIHATDIRDVIFLASEIRLRVRDVALFTYGSHTLYAHPDVSLCLRGMLVVSTYPVAVESQFWDLTQPDRQRVSFTGDMAAGLYNAVLLQLGGDAADAMVDYTEPLLNATIHRPPVWVTTVGRKSLLPVAALRTRDDGGEPSSRPVIEPNTSYLALRTATVLSPSAAQARVLAQEGGVPRWDVFVFVLLATIGFAWMLRDQLGTTEEDRRDRPEARRWMSPNEIRVRLERDLEPVAQAAQDRLRWDPRVTRDRSRRDAQGKQRNRIALLASLLGQRELYTILRVIALVQVFFAALLLLLRARSHVPGLPRESMPSLIVAALLALWVIVVCIWRFVRIMRDTGAVTKAYLRKSSWEKGETVACWMWRGEIAGRILTFTVGLVCLFACISLMLDVAALDPVAARTFYYRSTSVTAGVTPAIPLLLGGVLFYAWCVWNARRITLLVQATTFEQLYLDSSRPGHGLLPSGKYATISTGSAAKRSSRPAAATTGEPANTSANAAEPRRAPATPETPAQEGPTAVGGPAVQDSSGDGIAAQHRSSGDGTAIASDTTRFGPSLATPTATAGRSRLLPMLRPTTPRLQHPDIRREVRQVRVRLFLSVPGAEGVAIFGMIVCLGAWSWLQFNPTMEGIILPLHLGLTSFDLLLRISVLGAFAATAFGIYRLLGVWRALNGALRGIAETPLVHAFRNLPEPVPRLTRLSPFDEPSDTLIEAALNTQWNDLKRIHEERRMSTMRKPVYEVRRFVSRCGQSYEPPSPSGSSILTRGTAQVAAFDEFHKALEAAWCAWPHVERGDRLRSSGASTADREATNGAKRPSAASNGSKEALDPSTDRAETPEAEWLHVAGQCAAIYVVAWIEWVLHHLRSLAGFLMTAIIVMTLLLSSYPFQPQSAFKAAFIGISIATIGALVLVLMQMNKNEVLSRITDGDAGRVNWNGSFVATLGVYTIIPLLTLLSTEFPAVRDFLFSWVSPLLRAMGKG